LLPQETASAAGHRLRLGVDLHTFDGIFQGSRSHLLGLYGAAIELAPDIDFVFLLAGPDALRNAHPEFRRDNVALATMPHRPGPWRVGWQLAAAQRRHALDLLHVQYRLPLLPSGPCLCTLHDVLFETHPQYFGAMFRRMASASARRAVRGAALTLTVSDYSRREIARHYPIDADRVVLTPNAVDPVRFHPPSPATDSGDAALLTRFGLQPGGYLCSLGRLEPRKNHLNLVDAYALACAAPSREVPALIIIGQRDFAYASVFERIRRLGLDPRIRILETVDDAALPVLLRHARVMAYPSMAEGFGMPVLEALASGVPVITSNTTSLPEVAGDAAWLVDPADPAALAAALRAALDEPPAARQERIRRGITQSRRFTWKSAADALLAAVRAYPR
jgi:glycosyltransferase involved in cell wall biosynthesis